MSTRILVIEDEVGFRSALQDALSGAGYQVESTPYLASAVGAALSGIYDLITLDLRMPGIDGVEIAHLFKHLALPAPIVVISGYLTQCIMLQLKEAGIRHILTKPVDLSRIIRTVGDALAAQALSPRPSPRPGHDNR